MLAAMVVLFYPGVAIAQEASGVEEGEDGFAYEDRSTVDSIPFLRMEEDSLSRTAIEGGLEAPAAGVPVRAATATVRREKEEFFLDPLTIQPRDGRTDLGRNEIPFQIEFSNPKSVPGSTFGTDYRIQLPSNRTYETFNANVQER